MSKKPPVYEGDYPFIFVSYAHMDGDAVLPIIDALEKRGYRVWYDNGVDATELYRENIANHVYGCYCFVAMISTSALKSKMWNEELNYALNLHRRILPVYLEEVELNKGLQMGIGSLQALYYDDETDQFFFDLLFRVKHLEACLTKDGLKSNGVKRRKTKRKGEKIAEENTSGQRERMISKRFTYLESINIKPKFADYSWDDLKEIAKALAQSGSSAECTEIARMFNLVDEGSMLQGEIKRLDLNNGISSGVRIIGFRHDELENGDKAGITFEFADSPLTHYMNPGRSNRGGWDKSEMRKWLNGTKGFLSMLPNEIRRHICPVKKRVRTQESTVSEYDQKATTQTIDSLWLLSVSEIFGKTGPYFDNIEGMQYQFYADQDVSTNNYVNCKKRGSRAWWWLRSKREGSKEKFRGVSGFGDLSSTYANNNDWGISPCFCF